MLRRWAWPGFYLILTKFMSVGSTIVGHIRWNILYTESTLALQWPDNDDFGRIQEACLSVTILLPTMTSQPASRAKGSHLQPYWRLDSEEGRYKCQLLLDGGDSRHLWKHLFSREMKAGITVQRVTNTSARKITTCCTRCIALFCRIVVSQLLSYS
jgi:hypothetical protein